MTPEISARPDIPNIRYSDLLISGMFEWREFGLSRYVGKYQVPVAYGRTAAKHHVRSVSFFSTTY
jgi:hypothetical protein